LCVCNLPLGDRERKTGPLDLFDREEPAAIVKEEELV